MKAIQNKLKKASGSSLAELLICVVLLSLVSLVGISGLLFAYRAVDKIQTEAEAWEVSATILNRIEGELSGMLAEGKVYFENNSSTSGTYQIIAFNSSSGVPIYVTLEDDKLLIHYRETKTSATTTVKESSWTFDESAYHGYKIDDLTFTYFLRNEKLVIKTEMELISPNGKVFNTTRTTGCFNKSLNDIHDPLNGVDTTTFLASALKNDASYWAGISSISS